MVAIGSTVIVLGSVIIFFIILTKLEKKGIYLIPNAHIIEQQYKARGTVVEGNLIDVKQTKVYTKKTYTDADDIRNYDNTFKVTYSYVINQQQYTYNLLNEEPDKYDKILLYYDPNNNNKIMLVTSLDGETVLQQKQSKAGVWAIVLLAIIDIILVKLLIAFFG